MKASELKKVIANAKKVIKTRNTLYQIDNAKIEGGFLTVSDLDITYSQRIDISENVSTTIDFKELEKIVKRAPKTADIRINAKDFDLVSLEFNKSKFSYKTCTVDEYNDCIKNILNQDIEQKDVFTEEIVKELKTCTKFVANDPLRVVMNGVYLSSKGNIVASDSHVMRFRQMNHNIKSKPIIPVKAIKALSIAQYVCYESEKYITLANEKEIFTIRKIEGNYPKWKAVIPEMFETVATLDKNELIEQTKLAEIAANQASHLIKFSLTENSNISSQDLDFERWYRGEIECKLQGQPQEIGVKSDNILKILDNCEGEKIKLEIVDPSRAIRVNESNLIMPMML